MRPVVSWPMVLLFRLQALCLLGVLLNPCSRQASGLLDAQPRDRTRTTGRNVEQLEGRPWRHTAYML